MRPKLGLVSARGEAVGGTHHICARLKHFCQQFLRGAQPNHVDIREEHVAAFINKRTAISLGDPMGLSRGLQVHEYEEWVGGEWNSRYQGEGWGDNREAIQGEGV